MPQTKLLFVGSNAEYFSRLHCVYLEKHSTGPTQATQLAKITPPQFVIGARPFVSFLVAQAKREHLVLATTGNV